MRVTTTEITAVSSWHWDLNSQDELCGICRVAFDGTCPNCKYPGAQCPLVLGAGCPHNFHLHCIVKWLEQDASKGLCPMCRQVFVHKAGGEVGELQLLIDGHKAMRERLEHEEFGSFDE